jgi:hypothetical protein
MSSNDFNTRPKTLIIEGNFNPLQSVVDPRWQYTIRSSLNEDSLSSRTPDNALSSRMPIFYSQGNIIYLVQSTVIGNAKSAYALCVMWKNTGRNGGIRIEPSVSIVGPVVIYVIKAGGLLAAKYENKDKSDDGTYYEIVRYDDEKYAALLRL